MANRGRGARTKGAQAEREVAELIQKHGFDAHRGKVFYHEPDVIGLDGFHIEVKRRENYYIDDWLKQSEQDAEKKQDGIPLVVFRKSRQPWRVILDFEEFLELVRKANGTEK